MFGNLEIFFSGPNFLGSVLSQFVRMSHFGFECFPEKRHAQ